MPRPAGAPRRERQGWAGSMVRQWPWFVTAAGFAAGTLYAALPPGHWRRGAAVMGASLLLGAGLRVILGPRSGLLRVRSRWLDTLTLVVLGAGIMLLAFWVPALRPSIDR